MIRFRKKGRQEEGINPTPMVDVMFNLLIFVIVTAQYTNVQALKVTLPKAQTGAAVEKVEKLVITVTKDESLLLNGESMSPERFEASLKSIGQEDPQPLVLIQADQKSTTGQLVNVMDVVSKSGLKKISIETKK